MAKGTHLSFEERLVLENLISVKTPIPECAVEMRRSAALIYGEIARSPYPYSAVKAQREFEDYYENAKVKVQGENKKKGEKELTDGDTC